MTEKNDISRRDMLRGRFVSKTPRPQAARVDSNGSIVMRYPKDQAQASPRIRNTNIPIMRPPGAIDESTFLAECTRCDACLEACPHDAIVHAPQRFRDAAGTPMIDADQQPCKMCEDLPCIDACEPDVLSHSIPIAMGTARITAQTCLAHNHTTCTVCFEHCPVVGAIEIRAGKPQINEDQCTGCGICRHVCPAPENAILLMPTFIRPKRV